jgi:pimeloyl-ACP methyl ester carboxylesterase
MSEHRFRIPGLPRSVSGAFAILIAVSSTVAAQAPRLFAPEVQVQTVDYAEVRAHFRTQLVRKGPSPQEVLLPQTPDYVEEVEFPSGKLRLKAWLAGHRSTGAKLPAVLFLHGGFAFGAADWDMAVPYWQAGFVVMVPILRAENGQPGTFSFLYDEVDDVVAAAKYLASQPSVDPTRIYLAGHSAGGTLTLLTVEASRQFRAAASFDGSPDQQLLYNGSASKPGVHQEVVFDPKDLRELQVRSPLAYVTSLKTPTRLYYSEEATPIIELPTQRLVELGKRRGLDVAQVRVNGSHMSHVAEAMQQSILFFKSTLSTRSVNLLKQRSVPPLKPSLVGNTTFTLTGHAGARTVALAGSFNGWDSQHVLCAKETGQWVCRLNLPEGKYLYQFVVDDEWILDPDNPLKEDSGNGGQASVIVKK